MKEDRSLLGTLETSESPLKQADRLGRQAASVGFDWRDAAQVLAKVREETDELAEQLESEQPSSVRLSEELGDLLFAVVNVARKLGVDPEHALRNANLKFSRRFHHIERRLAELHQEFQDTSLERLEELWEDAKRREAEGEEPNGAGRPEDV